MKAAVRDRYGSPDVVELQEADKPDLLLRELLEAGKVRPVVESCYELSDVADALRYLGEGHAQGKLIITV